MSRFGLDYTTGPSIAAMKAHDPPVTFVCRYVSTPGNPKNITRAEADQLRKNGIDVVIVFETTADRAKSGLAGGKYDAVQALAQANGAGAPPNSAIYFAVDFDATEAQQDAINAYLRGAASVLGHDHVGVYGGYYVVKRALDAGVCKYAWQTYAWSGGQWEPRAHLQQYLNAQHVGSASVDFNRAVKRDFGQWRRRPARYWLVVTKDRAGHVVRTDKTRHPAAWAAKHWRRFRRYASVSFKRRSG